MIALLPMLVSSQIHFLVYQLNMVNVNHVVLLNLGSVKVFLLIYLTDNLTFIHEDNLTVFVIFQFSGHFGYIELPIPIYHPNHITELKKMLSLLCLKCLKMKKNKVSRSSFPAIRTFVLLTISANMSKS